MCSTLRGEFESVNDTHSALNQARAKVLRPTSMREVSEIVRAARTEGVCIASSGGRHAMGGQQFADGQVLLDLRELNRLLEVDAEQGLVRVEGGIQWPALIHGLIDVQPPPKRWAVAQKQTGADALTLGGSISANIHGRGLTMQPLVSDIESFTLIDASGHSVVCKRTQNGELFSLAVGGYGLFGVIVEATLRLAPRRTLRRIVRVIDIQDAVSAAQRRIDEGALYGDFQFDIDARSSDFLTKGVFSCYTPVDGDPKPPDGQKSLSRDEWMNLLTLAHTDKTRAFNLYAQHYLATDGQLYETDTHQLGEYIDGYHLEVDRRTGARCPGSEMITELYVPPERLVQFLQAAAQLLVQRRAQVIYGTARLIQPETETVLAWAPVRYACTVLNLHVDHTVDGIAAAADTFRALIDLAIEYGGSYYLTYHRFATPGQFERCYPRVREFFAAKRRYDPTGLFQSDWHRHYASSFAETRQ